MSKHYLVDPAGLEPAASSSLRLQGWSILEKVRTHFQENPADDF